MRLHSDVSDKELNDAIDPLIGKIKQLPPVRSAVKREIREREVLSFEILERNGKDVLFKSEVEAGTYIRTLCVQIGEKIGGAHMLELRRIQAGIFSEEEIYTLYDFDKAVAEYKAGDEKMLRKMIIPAEIISTLLPVIQINDKKSLKQLLTGKPLMKSDCKKSLEEGIFCIFNKDIFIGVYKKVNEGDIIGRAEFIFN